MVQLAINLFNITFLFDSATAFLGSIFNTLSKFEFASSNFSSFIKAAPLLFNASILFGSIFNT